MSSALAHPPSDYIDGQFVAIDGDSVISTDPADPDHIIWKGSPKIEHIDAAIVAANKALRQWAATTLEDRIAAIKRWQNVTRDYAEKLASLITSEMGKTLAESKFEASALAGKVDITLDDISMNRVKEYEVTVSETRKGLCRYKPHGVMAVIGPFNFPAHLPNGHFVAALLMGNTIILKPSEKTPAVGQMLGEMMHQAELPTGVFNVVQGAAEISKHLVNHQDIDGILFTGSWNVGRRIVEANLDRPGRLIALEMGGNNPAVVMNDCHLKQAVVECVRASFATTGQRCTCTRRIIVQREISEKFIPAFCKATSTLIVGAGNSNEPVFMGPLVSEAAVNDVLKFQDELVNNGGQVLVEATKIDRPGHFISPGVVQVDKFTKDRDCEVFGPLVQISIVDDLDQAIKQANATRYGLAASIFTTDDAAYEKFFQRAKAGCINRNTGTAGASGKLPFGGLGLSGNHRPAAAYATDYCAYPVANMVEQSSNAAIPNGMYWDDSWTS